MNRILKLSVLSLVLIPCVVVCSDVFDVPNMSPSSVSMNSTSSEYPSIEERINQAKRIETGAKNFIKQAVKNVLPTLMNQQDNDLISKGCRGAILKYISALTSAKVWAIHMLDATSKPMSGIFDGTTSEYGGFDQCLRIAVPKRGGGGQLEFRGQYCALEASPRMPPIPSNYSMAAQAHAGPLDSLSQEVLIGGTAFYYLKFRIGLCLPSKCTLEDMQSIAKTITSVAKMNVEIPQCYVQESVTIRPIHIVVICILSVLFLTCLVGTILDQKSNSSQKPKTTPRQVLQCFSVVPNLTRLVSASKGSEELKALHGLRALSMAWVLMGHTYVWVNFQLMRSPTSLQILFNRLDFEAVLNGWLSVEPFFFLSGLLSSFAVLKIMEKTKGKLNVPVFILRRYIRLTPALLLTMGLAFFMPLVSSGPFWYERVDPELKACTQYWWANILYISNWSNLKDICVHPTWYLSADFQLYIVSIVVFFTLHRSAKLGLSLIGVIVISCSVVVGVLTLQWDLPPTIQISSGNNPKIQDTINIVHIRTFTHAGPYFVGIVVGYLMIKYKDIKMSKVVTIIGWFSSTLLCLTAVYGPHRWNTGHPHGPLLTAVFAAVHRTTFTMGVAWVTFACVTGHGGVVNRILSSSILAPFGRLTFMVYLLHSLVIWVRTSSLRERLYFSHYNLLYEYLGNTVFTLVLTVPVYLLLEAPLSNLERLVFSRARLPAGDDPGPKRNGATAKVEIDGLHSTVFAKNSGSAPDTANVELKGVKSLDLVQNTDDERQSPPIGA